MLKNKVFQFNNIQPMKSQIFKLSTLLVFGCIIVLYVNKISSNINQPYLLITAAIIGAYMAINIGANDVANNVGPAVGSKALTLGGAIVIAAVFESMGAIIAGGEVINTVKKGIIDPALIQNSNEFVWLMTAALFAAAIWLNIATSFGAPVSTTHSVVGGILGAGIAAGGFEIANWQVFGKIVASWVISPVLGGIIAASFLYLIKRQITYHRHMIRAAKKIVPLLIAAMIWVFATYIILKGLKKVWNPSFFTALGIGCIFAIAVYLICKPLVQRISESIQHQKESVNELFTLPLILSAALLSFAHGANDVANAIGPLAAINETLFNSEVIKQATIPLWILLTGAIGIALGLAFYGPKLIRTVGTEITELDKMRAFCIAMAAAITVILASQFGLPVSSTHITVGAIFGVGFLREHLKGNYVIILAKIKKIYQQNPEALEDYLEDFETASLDLKQQMLSKLKASNIYPHFTKQEKQHLQQLHSPKLVTRSHLYRIAAAWIITVPISGILAAILYFTIRGFMLP